MAVTAALLQAVTRPTREEYATTDDDPRRLVSNPAQKKAHKQLLAARARYDRAPAGTDAPLLDAVHHRVKPW